MKSQIAVYETITRQLFWDEFAPTPVEVPPAYRVIQPWKMLKLLKIQCQNYRSAKLRHLTRLDSDLLGFMRMFTLLFCPAYEYNLPLFSVDIILMGASRVFILELIDPAGTSARAWQPIYAGLQPWHEKTAALEQRPVTEWHKSVLHPASIHVKAHAADDALLLEVYKAYLSAYVEMLRQAQPEAETARAARQQAVEGYVGNLLSRGGPAVDTFKTLVGEEGQKVLVRQVMFGVGN